MTTELLATARESMRAGLLSHGASDDQITSQIAHGYFNLAEFLLARIAEDEARPHDEWCSSSQWKSLACDCPNARVLAECEAKRRLVNAFLKAHCYTHNVHEDYAPYAVAYNCVLKDVAVVYADHADYDSAWTPT